MRKWKILFGALALIGVAVALLARNQLNRDIIQLKNGRIIPVDRVWESGADLFYENEQEIHFISLADIQSIEKQSISNWLRSTGAHIAKLANEPLKAIHSLVKNGLGWIHSSHPVPWLLIGTFALPIGLVPAVRRLRKQSKKPKPSVFAAQPDAPGQAMPTRADMVRFFLSLYRQQLGFGPEVPADFAQLPSSPAGAYQIYELRVKNGEEWIKRRMTLGPLGEDSGSKSKCYYVIFDQHLVVKIPPKPIVDFEDYVASIKKERHIVERLRPKECIAPRVSVILSRIHHLPPPSDSTADLLEERYIAWLRKTPAHQDYLKINGTFVYFMDLSRYYFLSHIIDSLHDLTDPIRSEINSTTDLIRYPAKFKERFGEQNESVGFEIRDLYHQCEAEIRQLLKNAGKSAAVTPYRTQLWFLNFLEKKDIGASDPTVSGPLADQVAAIFERWFEKYDTAVGAYLAAIRIFTARLCLQQNRQIISGIVANLLELLAWLSARNVAMRDLKPDNLLVAGDPQNYPAFLRSASDYSLGFIDVETAVYLEHAETAAMPQPLLGGTPYYATPSHLFPNHVLQACLDDTAWVLHFQDWYAVLVMAFRAVTGRILFDRTASLFGDIKNRVSDAMRQRTSLETVMEVVSRRFWRSAAAEFRAKMKAHESALQSVEVDLPQNAKELFLRVLQRELASLDASVRRLIDGQRIFSSPESRDQLRKSSRRRVCQILKAVQAKMQLEPTAPDALKASERFLQHLSTLKALTERNAQITSVLNGTNPPRLNAYELLLLMFNCVLKTMCRENWYAFSEDAALPMLPRDDELSLATTM